MNWNEIVWPCELSDIVKQGLCQCAVEIVDLEEHKIDGNRWKMDGLYYISQGGVGVSVRPPDSNFSASAILGATDWMGSNSIFSEVNYYPIFIELAPLKILYFPRKKVEQLAQSNPEVYTLLFHASRLITVQWLRASCAGLYNREKRLARVLINYYEKLNGKIDGLEDGTIAVSQMQLSQLVGMTRPRVNETLKLFEQRKWISIQRGKITLNELDILFNKAKVF
ncbi:Crp/Fnr family transcriptional regulator [Ferrimonas lipolytica]|uniref:Crp/Fnr family transcriptional regulator n=1 Tax=Ferrimonas lipolytica TaxID=2724191 RepID=A0A6H1UHL5_9GAMM|nr:Crp/Fnr family transcriptional regulator [Ferrimonas lipolytica]QIZ77282.1 Crp/Fnr family transcriptional regulator [Ferrimonas lipolytica]